MLIEKSEKLIKDLIKCEKIDLEGIFTKIKEIEDNPQTILETFRKVYKIGFEWIEVKNQTLDLNNDLTDTLNSQGIPSLSIKNFWTIMKLF